MGANVFLTQNNIQMTMVAPNTPVRYHISGMHYTAFGYITFEVLNEDFDSVMSQEAHKNFFGTDAYVDAVTPDEPGIYYLYARPYPQFRKFTVKPDAYLPEPEPPPDEEPPDEKDEEDEDKKSLTPYLLGGAALILITILLLDKPPDKKETKK